MRFRRTVILCAGLLGIAALAGLAPAQAEDGETIEDLKKRLEELQKELAKSGSAMKVRLAEMQERMAFDKRMVASDERWPWATSADGARIAAGRADGAVEVWGAEGGPPVLVLEGHGRRPDKLMFHPSKPWLYSLDRSADIRVWDLTNGKQTKLISPEASSSPAKPIGMSLSDNGRFLAVGMADVGLHVLDTRHDAWRPGSLSAVEGDGLRIEFLPGTRDALVRGYRTLRREDLVSATEAKETASAPAWTKDAYEGDGVWGKERTKPARKHALEDGIQSSVAVPALGLVLTACRVNVDDPKRKVALTAWNVESGKRIARTTVTLGFGHWLPTPTSEFAYYWNDEAVLMFSPRKAKRIRVFPHPKEAPRPMGLAPDGKSAYAASADGVLTVAVFPPRTK